MIERNRIESITSLGITFVGIRTTNIVAMREIAELLGYKKTDDENGFTAYRTPQGQRLELFESDYPYPYFTTGPVPGFEVQDFEAALAWLADKKFEILGNVPGPEAGTRWVHFRGPDGNIYEFVYHPDLDTRR